MLMFAVTPARGVYVLARTGEEICERISASSP